MECNVNFFFFFSKWECMVLIWKMGIGLVIFFYNLSKNTCFVYIFWTGLSYREKRLYYERRKWTNREHGKIRSCLDSPKTEWYHSVFMIHHPKLVGPTNDIVFGLIWDVCFHHSKTQNFEFGWWKLKTQFWCFQIMDDEW